jgi:hypothetical protein
MTHEVVESAVFECAASAVALDHEHLVAVLRVDMVVLDI